MPYFAAMDEATPSPSDRDQRTGRFLPGNSGFGGRPKGARSKLGEQFLEDLRTVWEERGIEALRRCAEEEPSAFVRVLAGLLPRDLNINATTTIGIDPTNVLTTFRTAIAALGNQVPARLPRAKVINNAG
jgi:hypothetical protein